MESGKLYTNHEAPELLGEYFIRHMQAMEDERLIFRADIAAELAYRDMLLDAYRAKIKRFLQGDSDVKRKN